jgi:predicted Zn-dependent peptidase
VKKLVLLLGLVSLLLPSCRHALLPQPGDLPAPPLEVRIPSLDKTVLENGITLYHREDGELPLVSVSVLIGTGSAFDPPGKEGLAELTGGLLRTGGTLGMASAALDEELDFMAAEVSVEVEREATWMGASFLKEDLGRGLHLLSRMLLEPAFEKEKFALAKNLKKDSLRRILDNPSRLAFREFFGMLYGDDPRGRLETLTSVEGVRREDLVRFYESSFFPGNVRIAVTGDIGAAEALKEVTQAFGSWRKQGTISVLPPPKPHGSGVYLLKKDLPQSVIVTGQIVSGSRDEDHYAFEVLDFILGSGGFRSRIFGRVRNALGLAYSAGSFYVPRGSYGVFAAYAMTRSDATARVAGEIAVILKKSGLQPMETDEIEWAKESLVNQFVFSLSSAGKVARQQMLIDYQGLPADYLSRYRENIRRVTVEDVERASRSRLGFGDLPMLVLGDDKAFDGPLDAFGPVRVISSTGLREKE